MIDTIRVVIAWTCVAVFIASAIITILALLRVIRLPSEKYLNRLFAVVIVAVVGTCASFFQDFIRGGGDDNDKKPVAEAGQAGGVITPPTNTGTATTQVAKVDVIPPKPVGPTNRFIEIVVPPTNRPIPPFQASNVVITSPKPGPQPGWIGFKNSGAYVAKFYLNWKEDGQPKSWSSGNKTACYSEVITLKTNAREIKITAQAATGLVWDPWGTIFRLEVPDGPPNKFYVAKGTTLKRSWTTAER